MNRDTDNNLYISETFLQDSNDMLNENKIFCMLTVRVTKAKVIFKMLKLAYNKDAKKLY